MLVIPLKILIIEDSPLDRLTYQRYLRSDPERNYLITVAETLEDGLTVWRSQQPDLVLLDMNLPDGNGLAFLEAIRPDPWVDKLPVIMLTDQGDERMAVRAMKLGAADYLVKGDLTPFALLTSINQVQESYQQLRQLRRSQQQQSIVASMALNTRSSLNFEQVANRIVEEIRRFLEADRTVIYRFNPDMSGVIVAEAIVPPWLPCLDAQVEDTCFQKNLGGEYQQGKIFMAADIYEANLTECHVQLLERFQVRANLVVPILLDGNNTLWGLLIAHQCSAPRQWQEEDIQLLQQLSAHLSVALQQSELYQNLQTMNSLLEEKVQERTKQIQLQTKVLEEIHDGVVTTDSNGIILSWNRGSEKLYGYTETEVLGQNIAFIYANTETLQTEVITPLLNQDRLTTEVSVIAKSGECVYVSLQLSTVKDEQGNIIYLIGCANDITKRKLAEQELQRLNHQLEAKVKERTQELKKVSERLALALKSGAIGCWDWDIADKSLYWDSRMYEIYGITQSAEPSLTYDAWINAVHPDDIALVEATRQQVTAGVSEFDAEFRIVRPDGTICFIKDCGLVFRDDLGNIQRITGINFDISDRKATEAALRESEAKFRRLVEGANDLIWSTGTQGIFDYLSPQFQTLFGFDPNDWIGKSFTGLVHPEDRDWVMSEQMRSIESEQTVSYIEFRHLHQEGHYLWVSVNATPIIDEDGLIIGAQGILADINNRKKAEQEILESRRLVQQIADSSPNVLYLYDLQEQRNVYANREVLSALGYSVSEIQAMGSSWLQMVIHPDDLPRTLEHFERLKLADDNTILCHEYRFRHADGRWRFFYSRDSVFSRDSRGQVKLMIGTAQDVTELKLAEAQLQQKNLELEALVKLREEALTLREDMSNMIVHDLRNPLTGMLLSAEIIKKYSDRPINKAILLKQADQILASGKRLYNMIDSLLLMAKLESGKIIFNPIPTDLYELGNSILNDFELSANAQKIELKRDLPLPKTSIIIDEIILRRVIENLISNALKFSPPNSQVLLQIEYLPENRLRIQVLDNGPGVSSERAEEIFNKFEIGAVQANVSQIGLGLAFCKMAVEAQGGTLTIAPNQPQGSIFIVEI